ncbi:hypothetical protein SAMN05421756_102527 [Microlunatus flavus]|uniref:Right handed beta helix region n=1 Tax=Microlunatus flavus TaxID=1036181 RepID=A0A1H9DHM4_9ACTN|nr:hypothetical protein SAMN05421756_102527 [Microlunatus flavus]
MQVSSTRTGLRLAAGGAALLLAAGCATSGGSSARSPAPAPVQPSNPPASASAASTPVVAGPATTGVPPGTGLKPYTGPTTITTPGTVIDAATITDCLVIKADDVTISRSRITSPGCQFNVLSDAGNTGLRLVDVEIDGQDNTTGDSAVAGAGYTCLRCDVQGTTDGFKAGSDVTIQDSWIHDLAMTKESHNDGVQSLGTNRLTIGGSTIVLADGATSAVILSTGSASAMRNVSISDNVLGGGAFTVYGGYSAGEDDVAKVSGIAITNNRFSTKIHPRSGAYGPITSADPPVVVSGNTWYDGPEAGRSLS